LNQTKFGELLRVSRETIARIETGNYQYPHKRDKRVGIRNGLLDRFKILEQRQRELKQDKRGRHEQGGVGGAVNQSA
jgi:hypothetical protein